MPQEAATGTMHPRAGGISGRGVLGRAQSTGLLGGGLGAVKGVGSTLDWVPSGGGVGLGTFVNLF